MDTPYTMRAQELRDIYNTLCMKYLTQDERLDVLLTLKHTVKEHDCKLTHEIIELIDREADLLMRGVKENNLEGTCKMRKSVRCLFFCVLLYCALTCFSGCLSLHPSKHCLHVARGVHRVHPHHLPQDQKVHILVYNLVTQSQIIISCSLVSKCPIAS
jgi:hypothetical protein